jgi:SCP-2 sterol transfer family
MCGGWHVIGVESGDLRRVLEDHLELGREVLDLVVGEREPRQLRDVLDVGARQTGHAVESRSRTPFATMPLVATYVFLSDEWFVAVREIVEARVVEIPPGAEVSMNLVVTGTPFGDDRQLHVGAREGRPHWGTGHETEADLTLTTDYETAKSIFMSGDPQAGMQAFMEGKVKLQGDLTKLMAAQVAGTGPGAPGLAEELSAITE